MKKVLNIKIGGTTGAGKSTFLFLIEEMLIGSGLNYYLHLDDEEIRDRLKNSEMDHDEMLKRLEGTEINIQTQRLISNGYDFSYKENFMNIEKENRELRDFIKLLEKDKEKILDELKDIECMGSLAKLLREHGRR